MRTTPQRAARFLVEAVKLMRAKDHDYGEAWKELSVESHIDRIRVKLARLSKLIEFRQRGEEAQVSDGIKGEVLDIINYAIFVWLALEDQDEQKQRDQGSEGSGSGGAGEAALQAAVASLRAHPKAE